MLRKEPEPAEWPHVAGGASLLHLRFRRPILLHGTTRTSFRGGLSSGSGTDAPHYGNRLAISITKSEGPSGRQYPFFVWYPGP